MPPLNDRQESTASLSGLEYFPVRWLVGLGGALSVYALMFMLQVGTMSPSAQWTAARLRAKISAAQHAGKRKLVVVGGSSVMYGIRSSLLETEHGLPVFNLGVNAQLRMRYTLSKARQCVSDGDAVLLAFEYDQYVDEGVPSQVLIDFLMAADPAEIGRLSVHEQVTLAARAPLIRIIGGLQRTMSASQADVHDDSEHTRTMNARGDEVGNAKANRTVQMEAKLRRYGPQPSLSGQVSAYSRAQLTEFVKWAKQHSVSVVATWPPVLRHEQYEIHEATKLVVEIEALYRELNVPLLGTYKEAMYSRDLLFDTEDHLTAEGAHAHTARLSAQLAPFISSKASALAY